MINPRAITIISERFQGRERVQMLSYRGSAEVVGMALLTLAVGQLFAFWLDNYFSGLYSWLYCFSIVSFVCSL